LYNDPSSSAAIDVRNSAEFAFGKKQKGFA